MIIGCGSDLSYNEQISQYNKLVSLTDSLNEAEDFKKAVEISTQAIKITDTLSQAFIQRGKANYKLKNFDDANDDFSLAYMRYF